ncbi:YqiA/YcfP family alpha/beta fold hydrolase [Marinomonas mediterranea]|nr:YqiA/YcfP family alpha/beta fold hydrolase [Marinomonas mediterranea]WCN10497.1 hypothetical protein GV055_17000 [Marinomonas mediterranea]WCN14546.1 hypothetical protein GV054_16825 [Marinomonas mediterranea]WCN18597.1 hypothetical protein GV053_16890 [Marinomonas mediterranea MMB-1]
MTLIYVHGFNSSERSFKSQLIKQAMASIGKEADFYCPRLHWQPYLAIQQLEVLIEGKLASGQNVALVGSSLGGFYSLYLSEKYNLKAVLINPAVEAPILLQDLLGVQENPYTNERYTLTQTHIEELQTIDVTKPTGNNIWLMLQEGDEVLDYQAALNRFKQVERLTHEKGGDHSFVDFDRFAETILEFTGVIDRTCR